MCHFNTPELTWPGLTWPDQTRQDQIWSVLTWYDLAWRTSWRWTGIGLRRMALMFKVSMLLWGSLTRAWIRKLPRSSKCSIAQEELAGLLCACWGNSGCLKITIGAGLRQFTTGNRSLAALRTDGATSRSRRAAAQRRAGTDEPRPPRYGFQNCEERQALSAVATVVNPTAMTEYVAHLSHQRALAVL